MKGDIGYGHINVFMSHTCDRELAGSTPSRDTTT